MPLLKDWKINLEVDHVLRAQGADPGVARLRRPGLVEIAAWALRESLPLLEPAVLYRVLSVVSLTHERLYLDPGSPGDGRPFLSGALVTSHLRGAKQVVVMASTIGATLEDLAAELVAEEPLRGLALDAAGSAAAESLATAACNYFEALAAAEGLQTSLPLNPGMIGWPLEQGQAQIFSLLEPERRGYPDFSLRLTSSQLMVPRKSVSLVIGQGPELERAGRLCDFCSMQETCRYQNHYS